MPREEQGWGVGDEGVDGKGRIWACLGSEVVIKRWLSWNPVGVGLGAGVWEPLTD